MDIDELDYSDTPYTILRTPRGSVVVCVTHLVTDELKPEEALALRDALNAEHQKRMKS